ncbi:uncharacterized protein B0P05DRAFT_589557, partial [Gilbertella persicaria]|uniref:uncharacterized protein n=1 Tax=Gilbertella persicaria TaxID=101096 RepID=UPI00221E46FB
MSSHLRTHSLQSRVDANQQRSNEPHIEKLQVIIPQHLSKQFSPKADAGLRPLQTNKKRPQLQDVLNYYTEEPKEKKKPEYQLVQEKNVPSIIKDYRRKKQYKKMECLGQGAFAKVYRVATMEGQFLAAKVIAKSSLTDK